MKRVLAVLLSAVLSLSVAVVPGIQTLAEEPDAAQKTEGQQEAEVEVQAPSAVLMEASTGAVLYEKDADTRRAPASVTKIMTMLLIFDALEDGKIALEDEVSTSEYAASMGGSQVFLEPGETQSVDTMLKCISVASANDACTAMAEYIAGSEEAFVKMMNERAAGLGMKNTTFQNCNGLAPAVICPVQTIGCDKMGMAKSQFSCFLVHLIRKLLHASSQMFCQHHRCIVM